MPTDQQSAAPRAPLEPAVRDFLEAEGRFATVATLNADGSPHQAVLWFLVRDEGVVINSLEGRRWPDNFRRDPRLSFSVEDGYEYVVIRGSVEVLDDPEVGQADIAEMAHRYHEPDHAEEMIERLFRPQRRVSFLLRPDSVSTHGEIG